MPSKLRYDKAMEFASQVELLFRELSDFTDSEDDTVCIDMPDDAEAKRYVSTLADACLELDHAAQILNELTLASQGV